MTVADREAETWLTPRLAGIVDAVVIGEEACAATPSLRGRTAESQAWTVDPVDGTSNFVKGNERFCSMVSLLESGVPVRSWIWLPLANKLYYAQTGKGAFRSDMAFTAPHRLTLDGCDLALDDMKEGASIRDVAEPARTQMRDKLRALPGRWFPGSGGVLGTAIASGAQNFLFHATCTPWDHAPVDLLCREAGAHSAMMTSGAPYNATMAGGLQWHPAGTAGNDSATICPCHKADHGLVNQPCCSLSWLPATGIPYRPVTSLRYLFHIFQPVLQYI